ncbi:MAG: hypothetical protein JSW41_04320 [Candidatus Aenigmatarchaeota archaeon]|nr:MAG: hypothetical protein JSW41_04320 [Candidatus Aenigmarchaeota archaeon]
MVDYGKALSKGLSFGIKPKRWMQFFILDLVFLSIGLAIALPNLSDILPVMIGGSQDLTAALQIAGFAVSIMIVFVVWMLVRLWFMGAIVHQSYKEKDKISESFSIAGRKYLHILVTIIIVTVIAGAVSMIPYVGWVISFVVSWIFFFVLQGIVVSNMGFVGTLQNSYKIFRNKPLQVFLAWLLIAIVTIVIYFVFSIPVMILMFWAMIPIIPSLTGAQTSPEVISTLSQMLYTNLPTVIVVGIIALIGFAISQVFALKAQTEFYLQFKKRFKIF